MPDSPAPTFDVGLFFDPKFRRLARAMPDERDFAAAFVVWLSPLLASWRDGSRLTAAEGECAWVEATPERVDALKASGLLDDDGRVPEHAWASWFHPAAGRVFNSTVGGLMKSLGMTKEEAIAEARIRLGLGGPSGDLGGPKSDLGEPSLPTNQPAKPSEPSKPTKPAGRARGGSGRGNGTGANDGLTEPCAICSGPPDDTVANVQVDGLWVTAHARCAASIGATA